MPPVSELIRCGGYGEVCRSTHYGQPVAVKRFLAHKSSPEMVMHEAEMCRRLGRHPHMVYMLHADIVADDVSRSRLVFQLCLGTLEEMYMPRHDKPMDVALIRQFVPQFYSMLAYLNHLGIVHRDIKEANILVSAGHHLKLADFGSAILAAAPPPPGKHDVSTAPYLAPECYRAGGRIFTPAADMWSVGIVLHRMMSGRMLTFQAALSLSAASAPLPSPHLEELGRLVRRMLVVKHAERLHVVELGFSEWSKPPLEMYATVSSELFDAMHHEHNASMPHKRLSMYRHRDPVVSQLPPLIGERLDNTYCCMDDHMETAGCLNLCLRRMHDAQHESSSSSSNEELYTALLQLWLAFAAARTLMLHCSVELRQAMGMFMLRVAQPFVYKLCPALDNMQTCDRELFNCVRNVSGLMSFFGQCAHEWSVNKRPLPANHPAVYLVRYCNVVFDFAKTQPDAGEAERVRSWPRELSILLLHWNPILKHSLKS